MFEALWHVGELVVTFDAFRRGLGVSLAPAVPSRDVSLPLASVAYFSISQQLHCFLLIGIEVLQLPRILEWFRNAFSNFAVSFAAFHRLSERSGE